MTTTRSRALQQVIQYGIDQIRKVIKCGEETISPDDLLNHIYKTYYFVVCMQDAREFLKDYDRIDAITTVNKYEQDNFGELTSDLSDPTDIANMIAYIEGEKALNNCETMQRAYEKEKLSLDDLKAIKAELEAQLSL